MRWPTHGELRALLPALTRGRCGPFTKALYLWGPTGATPAFAPTDAR